MIREVIDFNNIGNVSKDAVEALYKDLDGIDFDYMLFDNTYYVSTMVFFVPILIEML